MTCAYAEGEGGNWVRRCTLPAEPLHPGEHQLVPALRGRTHVRPEVVERLPEWDELLGKRVRVWDGPGTTVRAEGEVIGIIQAPCLVIRRHDGSHAYESSDLPIDWRRDEWRKTR